MKKLFDHFPQILTYGVILAPKMSEFWTFSPKMTYFDQIDPINDIFDQIYVQICSLKVSKNYFSHVYGHKHVQICN